MEEEKKNKKQLVPIIVAVTALVVLVLGATYAYFAVGATNNFVTSTINATTDDVGNVILNGSNAALSMNLKASDMMKKCTTTNEVETCSNVTYYATPTGTSTDSSDAETVIGTASVSPNTDTNYYHCTYRISITQSYTGDKNMYNIFNGTQQVDGKTYTKSANELILTINGVDYDLNTNSLPKNDISGEFYIKNPSTVDITAGLKLINRSDKDQTLLAGSGVNITIGVVQDSFSCTAEEEPTSVVTYWTYEGTNVGTGYPAPNKVLDYRNLNKNYFIKETATQVVAEENIYEIQISMDSGSTYNLDRYYTVAELSNIETNIGTTLTCDGETVTNVDGTLVKCITHESGSTYPKQTYEVCSNYGNTLICMKNTDWENSETLKTRFEGAGLTCAYQDSSNNTWVGNTKPANGYLMCSEEDPTTLSIGEFLCYVRSDGFASCGVYREASCTVDDGLAVCTGW